MAATLLALDPASAQPSPSSATALPGLSALPKAPASTRLPGVDPRECGTSKHAALCAMGRWALFTRMDVTLTAGAFSGVYTMEKPRSGEVLTTYAERMPRGRRGGEVLLVSDVAYAYRTREKLPSDADLLDYMLGAPNMATQLVAVLLDQGVLEAPSDVTRPRTISAASGTQFLRTETPTMAALYGPPWRMTGTVRPGEDGRLAFALRLTFRPVDAAARPTRRAPRPSTSPAPCPTASRARRCRTRSTWWAGSSCGRATNCPRSRRSRTRGRASGASVVSQ